MGEWAVYEFQEVNKLHMSRFSSENRINTHTIKTFIEWVLAQVLEITALSQYRIDSIPPLSNDCTLITIFSSFV